MKAFIPDLDQKLASFNIHPRFFGEFRDLIQEGKIPGKELGTRLRFVQNYKQCLDALLAELSEPVNSPDHFESLEVLA